MVHYREQSVSATDMAPPPGFCEIDMVAHGGTSVAGSFIQTLTMVDVATGWTECIPLIARDGGLVVEAIKRAQSVKRHSILTPDRRPILTPLDRELVNH